MSNSLKLILFFFCYLFYSCTTSGESDSNTFTVGGTLSGNTGEVTLSLNGTSESFMGTSFMFTQSLDLGDTYTVAFVSSADGISCDITDGNGVISGNVSDIVATCTTESSNKISFDHTSFTGNLTTGDFNGDGFLDLAMGIRTLSGHPDGGNLWPVRIIFGDGDGNFNDYFDLTTFDNPSSNKVGRFFLALDFDQDGIDDFAVSHQSSLEIFKGMNNSSLTRISHTNAYAGEPVDFFNANDNSYPDVVSIVAGGSQLNYFGIYLNQEGILAEPIYAGHRDDEDIKALMIGYPLNFSIGDFNGDHSADILSVVQTQQSGENGIGLVLFNGKGDGYFNNPSEIIHLPSDFFLGSNYFDNVSREIGVGDFDGDGDLDIALMSSSNFIQIFINDGTGTFTAGEKYDVGNHPIHIQVEDFDMDGNLDIFTLNSESRDFSLLYGNGDGNFNQAVNHLIANNAQVYDVAIGDFDGNNFPDIAIAESNTQLKENSRGGIYLFFNPGLDK